MDKNRKCITVIALDIFQTGVTSISCVVAYFVAGHILSPATMYYGDLLRHILSPAHNVAGDNIYICRRSRHVLSAVVRAKIKLRDDDDDDDNITMIIITVRQKQVRPDSC